ncbi:MAG: hypothetical protein WCW64_00720 [Phycisphaerae bacterium]|jgi:tetratricopeptide (TPR) repeat protein
MTLILAGKANDGSLLVASDRKSIHSKTLQAMEYFPKILPLGFLPQAVVGNSGRKAFGVEFWDILQDVAKKYTGNDTDNLILSMHYALQHLEEQPEFIQHLEEVMSKVLASEGSDKEIYTLTTLFSASRDGPETTTVLVSKDVPHVKCVGHNDFSFPFTSLGRNDYANELLFEFGLKSNRNLSPIELEELFSYIISEAQKVESFVGDGIDTCHAYPDQKQSALKIDIDLESRVEQGKALFEAVREALLATNMQTIRQAVSGLDDLDVLRRFGERQVSPSNYAIFIDAYISLIPEEGKDHRLYVKPLVLEPWANDATQLRTTVNALQSKVQTSYAAMWIGRALLCLGDLTNDLSQYNLAITYLEGTSEIDKSGIALSWLGKAYAKIGKTQQAETLFRSTLAQYANKQLKYPERLAVLRSLKGLAHLGYEQYKPQFVQYATTLMENGYITKEKVRRI